MRDQVTKSVGRSLKKRDGRLRVAVESMESRVLFAAFTPGDIAVERLGDGSAALSSKATAVFVDEFTPAGATQSPAISVALPTATSGSVNALTDNGGSNAVAFMTLSANGQYLVLPGYALTPGSTIVNTSGSSSTRVVGRIDSSGNVDTSTSFTSTNSVRGAASATGTGFYVSGSGLGVQYIPFGGAQTATQITSTTGQTTTLRAVSIFNGQLYADAATSTNALYGPGTVGTGLPTTSGQAETVLPGFNTNTTGSPYQFVFKDASTIYIADSTTTGIGGIQKWTLSGGTWTKQYNALATDTNIPTADQGMLGLTIDASGNLYGTTSGFSANRLVQITDTGSGFTFTTLATAPANEQFHGVALAPLVPSVGSVTANPASISTGGTTSLTASNVTQLGASATVTSVSFYREAVFGTQSASDTLVGTVNSPTTGSNTNGSWTLNSISTTGLAANYYAYYAVATNSNGLTSGIGSEPTAIVAINNPAAPVIGSFSVAPSPDNVGTAATLTAANVNPASGDSVSSVKFYLETGVTPGHSANDTLLGTGTQNGSTYTLNFTPSSIPLAGGTYTLYAVANASSGISSLAAATPLVVATPKITFQTTTPAFLENAGTVTINVTRTGDTADAVTVNYATSNGTAIAGTNYTATSGTLSFAAGVTSMAISVPLLDAAGMNGSKTFTIALSGAAPSNLGTVISTPTAAVTIQDATGTFALSTTAYVVNETAGTAQISVLRTGNIVDTATVNYSTTDGTAKTGVNYTGTPSGTVNFAAGQSVGVITIPISNVGAQGSGGTGQNVSFTVTLTGATPQAASGDYAVVGTPASATETVIDSTLLTNNLSGSPISVTDIETSGPFTQSFAPLVGSTTAGTGSFGFLAYEVLEFSPSATPSAYPALGYTVNSLQNLSVQMFNTDGGTDNYGGHSGNFNIYFIPNSDATTPTKNLIFNTSDVNGLAGQGGTSASTLLGTFSFTGSTAGYDTYTPATLPPAVSSAIVTALNGGTPFRLALTPQTTGVAADWAGLPAPSGALPPVLSLSVTQTQTRTVDTFALSPTYTVNESAGTATITVTRNFNGTGTSDAASVQYATSDGTALAGTNYTAASGTLNFAAGQSSASFTVPVSNVAIQGGNKVVDLTLGNAVANPSLVQISQPTSLLTIVDNYSTAAVTSTISTNSIYTSYIGTTGPLASPNNPKFLDVLGSSDGSTFGTLDFNVHDGSGFVLDQANPISAINSISLGFVNTI